MTDNNKVDASYAVPQGKNPFNWGRHTNSMTGKPWTPAEEAAIAAAVASVPKHGPEKIRSLERLLRRGGR